MNARIKVSLTSWYVNQHRVLEVLGPAALDGANHDSRVLGSILGPRLLRWIEEKSIPSLAKLLAQDQIAVGKFFVHEGRYFSKGMAGLAPKNACLRYPLRELMPERTGYLEVPLHTDNLTTSSAFGALQGKPCVYVCGVITDLRAEAVVARPLVVGHLVEDHGGIDPRYANGVEIHPSDFDAFKAVDFARRISLAELDELKTIPEATIKRTFADLLGEPFVDKDWGGEIGDLFTANASIGGKPTTCGFMFKGPAVFRKLQPADCGKNGDQVIRLFEYPAQCFVLQHCHAVSPAVRTMMRALAVERFHQRARFCVIDGYQTLMILRRYQKLRKSPAAC